MDNIKFINWETKYKIIENLEKLRYCFFRELYGLSDINIQKVISTLVFYIKLKQPIIKYFHENYDEDLYQMCVSLVGSFFEREPDKEVVKNISGLCAKKPDEFFVSMMEQSLISVLKSYVGIPQSVYSQISYKFYWLKIKLSIITDFSWVISKFDYLQDKLLDWIEKMVKNKQLPNSVNPQKITQLQVFMQFVYCALTNSFAVHDVIPSLSHYGITKDYMLLWIKGIKRVCFVSFSIQPVVVYQIFNYLHQCLLDGVFS